MIYHIPTNTKDKQSMDDNINDPSSFKNGNDNSNSFRDLDDNNDIESTTEAANSQYSLHGAYVCIVFSNNLHILEYDVFFLVCHFFMNMTFCDCAHFNFS